MNLAVNGEQVSLNQSSVVEVRGLIHDPYKNKKQVDFLNST